MFVDSLTIWCSVTEYVYINQNQNIRNSFTAAYRAWNNQGQTSVYERTHGAYLTYSPVFLHLDQPFVLGGRVNGLCGNINGDPTDDLNPTIYTL